jgi:hypothetical protein
MLAGAAIPLGAMLFAYWWMRLLPVMPEIIGETKRYAAETPWKWTDLLKPCVVGVVVGFPIVVRAWVMRRHAITPRRESRISTHFGLHPRLPSRRCAWVLTVAVAWFAIEMLGAFLQRRMYSYHFYPVLAPAAVIFGCYVRRDNPGRFLATLAPVMLLSMLGVKEVMAYWEPQAHPAAAFVRAHTQPDDRVWSDCGARLALESDRALGSRYALMFLLSNYDEAPQRYGRILLADLKERKPKFVLIPLKLDARIKSEFDGWDQLKRSAIRRERYAQAWSDLVGFVEEHYRPVGWTQTERIYERR